MTAAAVGGLLISLSPGRFRLWLHDAIGWREHRTDRRTGRLQMRNPDQVAHYMVRVLFELDWLAHCSIDPDGPADEQVLTVELMPDWRWAPSEVWAWLERMRSHGFVDL